MKKNKSYFKKLIEENNWFASAGLTAVLYLVTLWSLIFRGGEGIGFMKMGVHLLLPLIALMIFWGRRDKRTREADEIERGKKRMEMHKTLSKIKQEDRKRGV